MSTLTPILLEEYQAGHYDRFQTPMYCIFAIAQNSRAFEENYPKCRPEIRQIHLKHYSNGEVTLEASQAFFEDVATYLAQTIADKFELSLRTIDEQAPSSSNLLELVERLL